MPVDANTIVAMLVGVDEKDVGTGHVGGGGRRSEVGSQ